MNRTNVRNGARRAVAGRVALAVGLACVLSSGAARAQLIGTGGTVGTTGGTLTSTDFFIGVQKQVGTNLSDVDKAFFLNRASCQCKRDVWLKAILNASSAATAATIAGTDTVTMYLGAQCNNLTIINSCLKMASMSFSQFRLTGMLVQTTVDVLAHSYGVDTTGIVSTGGVSGSGGDTGTGGTMGTGGATGTGGTTGTVLTTADDPCAVGDAFSQPVWLFVETTPGLFDVGTGQLNVVIDGTPPPTPTPVSVTGANEALIVDWTNVNPDNSIPDLLGYQVFCTRADQYQVFKDGTFDTSVDSCNAGATDLSPTALVDINTHFVCSDLLSASTTSARVQILENGVNYGIAVAAVDKHGNAALGFPSPPYTMPILTLDFYHQYRNGDPQGQATGGCAVAGRSLGGGAPTSGLAAAVVALGIAVRRRRRRRRS